GDGRPRARRVDCPGLAAALAGGFEDQEDPHPERPLPPGRLVVPAKFAPGMADPRLRRRGYWGARGSDVRAALINANAWRSLLRFGRRSGSAPPCQIKNS